MMNYNNLDPRTIREQVDMSQLWGAWIAADDLRRHSFQGALGWEQRSGKDYLYSRKRGVVKSLGPRNPETERAHQAFRDGKASNAARLASLAVEMDRQAAVLRSLGAGRLPVMAARVLRALRTHDKTSGLRVVGTNALFAYEQMAGVRFNADATATGDVDLLVDDRNRLNLLAETGEAIGLIRLVQQSVDKSFHARSAMDYRLTNDKGYMIEFIRPEPAPPQRAMRGAAPIEAGDIRPAPISGLQWLVNAPAVEVTVLDERGFPAPMRCPDPRHWAAHKLWLSVQADREAQKRLRDREQAEVLLNLIAARLPQFPLDESFRESLPKDLAKKLASDPAGLPKNPDW